MGIVAEEEEIAVPPCPFPPPLDDVDSPHLLVVPSRGDPPRPLPSPPHAVPQHPLLPPPRGVPLCSLPLPLRFPV